ncbi:two-component sensor histidine kinase [Microbacterium sorbitolivorans]|uniref:histidine kinase n=1 Tax=Microbacterium sorbitolivorans TaxID=1867410 RepID=A0A367XXK2_9MICO|nr:histidine kinase [Microbacterium sorbitolivorans]RCK58336.1 two-component sensor histidine kinase [Microbacterium sorbitolivorans]GGF35659.1 two-component sensor histidine kinase [Microbacterium sorbitolivorans]
MTTPDAVPGSPADPGTALALPRPPGILRRFIDSHPRTIDALIAVASAGIPAIGYLVLAAAGDAWYVVVAVVGAIVCFGLTFLRRTRPFLLLVVASAFGLFPDSGMTSGILSTWVALYSIGIFRSTRAAWTGFAIATAFWFTGFQIEFATSGSDPFIVAIAGNIVQTSVMLAIPTLIGVTVGARRRYERALIDRAADLARERDQRARLAVGEERTRIAREMHDIVSHSLTVMITLSEGAAAQAETGSDLAPDAMRRVAETGRESLAEMRRLLGVLRAPDDEAELAPQPGADGIGSLVTQFRDAGLPVAWRHDGPAIPQGGVGLAAYRIVQESLTNVLRHAPGTRRVDVRTRNDGSAISLTIDNDTTYDPMPSDGSGRGLVGMRERAAMHAGSVTAGPRTDGRWRVDATLSIDSPAGEK